MYDAGIVGCGVIGNRLAESFADHERTTVRAGCDLDEEKLSEFADEYDCEAFTDYRELVRSDDVDIVYVGVPPKHHPEIVAAALDHGKHVLCEKPIAEDAARGRKMVETAEESEATTAINLPFRYTPGFVEMRERVAAGDIGAPRRVNLTFRFPQWPREWQDVDWLTSREQGGPLREVGTHFLFGVQELFGPVESVSANVTYAGPDRYEDSVAGHFSVDGIHGTIDLVTDHQQSEENSITVLGSDAELSLLDWYRLVENRGEDDETVLNDTRSQTTLTLVDEFVAELDGEGGDLVSFEEANSVQRVLDALFASDGATRRVHESG
ncbi:Gfo/Idh/MocA family protein [Halorussus sp. MSC15.2]|uniref:Gfo/Idh/MocA family protein n=1 Tax=Halorussus sp. MSC15.2 TaxID=2283638 RepID=UPI0013D3D37C|nr:Gfo/Idh/MocA family oxidoreductase [Halorussus sp. MSC15.2]NEU58321.1 Gfo/Idh/MocA family oxidoreductase [Halorussus sp. MSC15.2]